MKKHLIAVALLGTMLAYSQSQQANQNNTKSNTASSPNDIYTIKGIEVSGNSFSKKQITSISGLDEGDTIYLPSEQLDIAVNKLWQSKSFSNVDIVLTRKEGNDIYLRFDVAPLPKVNEIHFYEKNGEKRKKIGKGKEKKLSTQYKVETNKTLPYDFQSSLESTVSKKYIQKGYPDAKVIVEDTPISAISSNLDVTTEKGPRVKISKINIEGAENISTKKILKAMKKTKKKNFFRILKKSKYVPEVYGEDLKKVIDLYQSKGYRDINITSENVERKDDNYIINISISEGKQYKIGNIIFEGNEAYSDKFLAKIFGYTKGDIYDAVGVAEKVSGNDSNNNIASLYYDNGYVFSNVELIEESVKEDAIDLRVKIREGEQARFNKITFTGNTKTHDYIVTRSLRTRPGDLFSKTDIQRTMMELSQIGYFEPSAIVPDIIPHEDTKTVDINYTLQEKGASQVELQGGYGDGRFVGTLGLTFGNFSLRNIFKKEAWNPIPAGDGQSISLRAQAGSNYRNYSVSFTEPWLYGKRPTALSVSLYNTQSRYNEENGTAKLDTYGVQAGISKLLNWPDNYFRLYYNADYQYYKFQNYEFTLADGKDGEESVWKDGTSNNLSFTVGLSRYSAGMDPMFPTFGSEFDVSLNFTLPYSLFNNKDYKSMDLSERYKWIEYYKFKMKAYWYQELLGKLVVKTGGEFGFLNTYNRNRTGISPFERFYMGGSGMSGGRMDDREVIPLRGYADPSSYGGASGTDITNRGGGVAYTRFMAEFRYPLVMGGMTKIYALGFLEAGNTWNQYKDFNPFELKRSAGIGIRVFLPQLGMLGFDFGYGFDPVTGGTKANGWEPHFILGQTF